MPRPRGAAILSAMVVHPEQFRDPARIEPSGLAGLDARSREIFRRIVESYLASGEPVGSRHLSRILPMPLSPASVRNVMQDLEELGLVYAPHTSAGRLPTEIGLRFFVDALLQIGDLSEDQRARIEAQVRAASRGSFEGVLAEATSLLSGLTRGASVVVANKENARLKQIEFVRLEPERALAVLVGEDGSVENRIVATPRDLPPSALQEAANYLNARIRGRTLTEVRDDIEASRRAAQAELDELTARLVDAGLASWAGLGSHAPQLIVRGQSNLLEDLDRGAGPRAHKAFVQRSRDQNRSDRPSVARRKRRGRTDFYRFREQAVLAVGLIDDRRAVPRRAAQDRRRARRHRPDAIELRAYRADGGLHRESGGEDCRGWVRIYPRVSRDASSFTSNIRASTPGPRR